jgi:hypothetical protein
MADQFEHSNGGEDMDLRPEDALPNENPDINDAAATEILDVAEIGYVPKPEIYQCLVEGCKWQDYNRLALVSKCLATWHVYEEHPEIWEKVVKSNRPPRDPDPRTEEGLAEIIAYAAQNWTITE